MFDQCGNFKVLKWDVFYFLVLFGWFEEGGLLSFSGKVGYKVIVVIILFIYDIYIKSLFLLISNFVIIVIWKDFFF